MRNLGILILGLLFFSSCSISTLRPSNPQKTNFVNHYVFKDPSGEYILKREVLKSKSNIKVRQTLYLPTDLNTTLEKSVTIAEYGTIGKSEKKELAIRPVASQFSIWFEKKKYFSQLKTNKAKKSIEVYLDSPEKNWQGTSSESFVKGTKFCWFGQLPECLQRIINNSKKSKFTSGFVIVWDGFPYYNEQYQNLSGKLFSPASIKFDGKYENLYRFAIEVEGQILFYHYDSDMNFQKMIWVSQGITVERNS